MKLDIKNFGILCDFPKKKKRIGLHDQYSIVI